MKVWVAQVYSAVVYLERGHLEDNSSNSSIKLQHGTTNIKEDTKMNLSSKTTITMEEIQLRVIQEILKCKNKRTRVFSVAVLE